MGCSANWHTFVRFWQRSNAKYHSECDMADVQPLQLHVPGDQLAQLSMVSLSAVSLRLLERILSTTGVARLLWGSNLWLRSSVIEEIRMHMEHLGSSGIDHVSFGYYVLHFGHNKLLL